MDWAITAGKRSGIVTTTSITDATPACLYAHSPNRSYECDSRIPIGLRATYSDIARQLIEQAPGNLLNVIMGGGKHMMGSTDPLIVRNQPKFSGSVESYCRRTDGRNLISEWLALNVSSTSSARKFVRNAAELEAIDAENVDHVLGLFADHHMSYSAVRDRSLATGEPTLADMTRRAIDMLHRNGSSASTGFVLVVEGGRIDHAHHQNYARLALQEMIEFDKAVETAINATTATADGTLADTLIIVTADHSHAMTLNGYPTRGNDILGFVNEATATGPYETLSYANGPGFDAHRLSANQLANGVLARDETWRLVDSIDDFERDSPIYQHQAMISLEDETHGGEDVPVYAHGPGARLIAGAFEQNYVAYAISYASCIGPMRNENAKCAQNGSLMVKAGALKWVYLLVTSIVCWRSML